GTDVTSNGWSTSPTSINGGSYATISDDAITAMLGNEIAAGKLPAPDANRLYAVYVAPNTVVHTGFGNSLGDVLHPGFEGYHTGNIDRSGRTYQYAVIVDPTGCGGGNSSDGYNLTTFQKDTLATSHEVA